MRVRKRRAAASFDREAFLYKRASDDLADRLEAIPRTFGRALALGAAGLMRAAIAERPALSARIAATIGADHVDAEIAADLEASPFAEGAFNLILAPLALTWINDLPGALIQLRRALTPDGLMLASLFGGATLCELRISLLEAELEVTGGAGARVAPFADLGDAASLLQRAGFALPSADRDIVTVRYREPMRLFADLRAMGETAALADRPARSLSRRILARTLEIYRTRFSEPNGAARATFEILTLTGWAPHASQPRPLAPGSARARLADALGTREQSAGEKAGS